MKKSAVSKTKELPITIKVIIDGQDATIKTDNVLQALRDLVIDPLKIKTMPKLEITYGKETYRKVFTAFNFKRLLTNDVMRQVTAKILSKSVGLTANNWEDE